MKLVYFGKTPLGALIYNPESKKGVALQGNDSVVIEMEMGFDPKIYPSFREVEVEPDYFESLMKCVNTRRKVSSELSELVHEFPILIEIPK